jgi:hypothetical protein
MPRLSLNSSLFRQVRSIVIYAVNSSPFAHLAWLRFLHPDDFVAIQQTQGIESQFELQSSVQHFVR